MDTSLKNPTVADGEMPIDPATDKIENKPRPASAALPLREPGGVHDVVCKGVLLT